MSEIGRELKAPELKEREIVVVKPPDKDIFITMWVRHVSPTIVEFYSGVMSWSVVNFVQPDGSLQDDKQRAVHVFEYLGKP